MLNSTEISANKTKNDKNLAVCDIFIKVNCLALLNIRIPCFLRQKVMKLIPHLRQKILKTLKTILVLPYLAAHPH